MPLEWSLDLEELEFHHPWILLILPIALALVVWNYRRRGGAPALLFPSVARIKSLPRTWRQRARILIPLFQALALILLAVAAARPQQGDSRTVIQSEGIAIQMVLDRSGSMEREVRFAGKTRTRMDVVKQVFADFVTGSDDLPGRKTDLIGLTSFARFTEESCPLVAQHEPLLTAVDNLVTVEPYLDGYDRPISVDEARRLARGNVRPRGNPLNATAIGDGLMRAIYSLVTAEEDLKRGEEEGGYKIKGKVIILLTDGEDNASEESPVEAGTYAAENGIRIYYILMREMNDYGENFFGQKVVVRARSKDELLAGPRQVAGADDRAFLATDGDALKRIYEQIDELERTEIGKIEYRSYEEKFHLFLLPGFALALCAVLLGETLLRRIP